MREPEGIETPLPAKSSERPWLKHREPDIRNVEAEGSSPFTSTSQRPRSEGRSGIPQKIRFSDVTLRDLIGVESADDPHLALTVAPSEREAVSRRCASSAARRQA